MKNQYMFNNTVFDVKLFDGGVDSGTVAVAWLKDMGFDAEYINGPDRGVTESIAVRPKDGSFSRIGLPGYYFVTPAIDHKTISAIRQDDFEEMFTKLGEATPVPTVAWDVDANLPVYTKDYLKMLKSGVSEGTRAELIGAFREVLKEFDGNLDWMDNEVIANSLAEKAITEGWVKP